MNNNAERFGTSRNAYNVKTEVDLLRVWNNISAEGEVIETGDANIMVAKRLPDGTRVQLRADSKTGGKAIDVRPIQDKEFKIHIEPTK